LEACFRETESKNSKQRKERKFLSRRKNPVVLKAEFGSPRKEGGSPEVPMELDKSRS
jgi:hypothetical protein